MVVMAMVVIMETVEALMEVIEGWVVNIRMKVREDVFCPEKAN